VISFGIQNQKDNLRKRISKIKGISDLERESPYKSVAQADFLHCESGGASSLGFNTILAPKQFEQLLRLLPSTSNLKSKA